MFRRPQVRRAQPLPNDRRGAADEATSANASRRLRPHESSTVSDDLRNTPVDERTTGRGRLRLSKGLRLLEEARDADDILPRSSDRLYTPTSR